MRATDMIPARVITVSDRCSAGVAEDLSGPLAARLLADHDIEASVIVVPDEIDAIRAAITAAVEDGARFVFTTGGTGLGLAIATEDVAIHGGRLQAYGEPGKGASFLMTLPKRAGEEIASRPLVLWEAE